MNPDAGENARERDEGRPDALTDLNQRNARTNSRQRPANSKQGGAGNRPLVELRGCQVQPSAKDGKQGDGKADGSREGQQQAQVAEQQHAMELIEVREAESPNRKAKQ